MPAKNRNMTTAKSTPSSPAKNTYLLAYNALSAALWAGVLYQTVTIGAHEINTARKAGIFFGGQNSLKAIQTGLSSGRIFKELNEYTRLTQSLAGLEVLHSLLGMPFSPSREVKRY
jgi:very-long-chain (3R)-3-hydroxyacyl-CoA dehydratase